MSAVTKTKSQVAKKSTTSATVKSGTSHPKFIDMIIEGLKKLDERSGSSRYALLKYITETYKLDSKLANQHVKIALKNGVKNGTLKQIKGVGSNGSFKIADASKSSEVKKKVAKKPVAVQIVKKSRPTNVVAKKPAAVEQDKPKRNVKKIVMPKAPKVVQTPVEKKEAIKEVLTKAKKTVSKPEVKETAPKAKSPVVAKKAVKRIVKVAAKPVEKKTLTRKAQASK